MCLDILESYILNWQEKIWHLILTKRPNSSENHSLEKIFMCLFIWRTKWHGVERETNIWSAGSLPKYQNTKIARSGPTWSQEPETTWSLPCNGRSASTPKCLWWNWLGSWQYSAMWCVYPKQQLSMLCYRAWPRKSLYTFTEVQFVLKVSVERLPIRNILIALPID